MKSAKAFSLHEVTPVKYACIIGSCPAVFETENEYLVVGRQVSPEKLGLDLERRVGPQEAVVAVPKKILNEISSFAPPKRPRSV